MTVSSVSLSTATVWHEFKDLERTILSGSASTISRILEKHKSSLLEPLKNSPRNAAKRQQVNGANSTPIETSEGPKNFPKSLAAEVCIISDLYDLDEFKTLELLLAAENRLSQFPGSTRGLVGVLLYWDGRFALLSALRSVCQLHLGVVNNAPGMEHLAAHFQNSLFDSQIVPKLVQEFSSFSVEGELDKLAKERGLGGPRIGQMTILQRHRRNVRKLLEGSKLALAESLFYLSFHERFVLSDILQLLQHLQKTKLDGNGSLSAADVTILFALGNALSVELKDQVDSISEVPLLAESERLPKLHAAIFTEPKFEDSSILGFLQFVWAVSLRSLSQLPGMTTQAAQLTEFDDQCLEKAFNNKAFDFATKLVQTKGLSLDNELIVQQTHKLVTDLIILMPLKIKELRKMSDACQWISLANFISEFYGAMSVLNLHQEFWNAALQLKSTHRCLALHDFLRIDMLPIQLYVPIWVENNQQIISKF